VRAVRLINVGFPPTLYLRSLDNHNGWFFLARSDHREDLFGSIELIMIGATFLL
jgi:hypothetical protein